MDESTDVNKLAYRLESIYRERDQKYAAVRLIATPPLFKSAIVSNIERNLISAMERRGLTLCRAHRSNDALIYEAGVRVNGSVVNVRITL